MGKSKKSKRLNDKLKAFQERRILREAVAEIGRAINGHAQILGSMTIILNALQEKVGLTNEEIQESAKRITNRDNDQQESNRDSVQSQEKPTDESASGASKLRVLRDEGDDSGVGS